MSNNTATIAINVTSFVSIAEGNVQFTMQATQNPNPGTVSVDDDGNITFTGTGPIDLTFTLSSSAYIFVGICFNKDGGSGNVGVNEFPATSVVRQPADSLTVIDNALASDSGTTYEYSIVIQEVSTGALGLIDPAIETEN